MKSHAGKRTRSPYDPSVAAAPAPSNQVPHPPLGPAWSRLEREQHHGLVQTHGLDRVLHEVRLRDDGRDGQADGDGHAAQRLRVLREVLVAAAHVARVEVGAGPHGGEVEGVDARLGEHEDADAGRFPPDAVQIGPGRVAGGPVREERLQQVPHVVGFGRDVAVHPAFEAVGLRHVRDRLGAGEEERPPHVGGDVAHQLPAEAGDLGVVVGREAAEEHGAEGEVDDELVDDAGDEEGSGFAGAHELHGGAGVGGEGEGVSESVRDELVFVLVGDADVVVRPCLGEVEEGGEFRDQIDSGCLVGVLPDYRALLAWKGVVGR